MNKTLALVALLGLVAAPAFAASEAAPATGEKKVMEATTDCSKAADKAACEKEQAEKAAKAAAEKAPAAGEAKKEEGKH